MQNLHFTMNDMYMLCTCITDVLRSNCVPVGCTVTQGRSDMSVHINR
jgi:hypothetical protein